MVLKGKCEKLPSVESLSSLFELTALANSQVKALTDAADKTSLTYAQLNCITNQLARCILENLKDVSITNPDHDRVVAVCVPPSSTLVICLIAIHKAGASYLPLDVTFPPSRVLHILQDARPCALLYGGEPSALQDLPVNAGLALLQYDQLKLTEYSGENLSYSEVGCQITLDSLAAVLYTSGSTGVPKGVRIPQRAVLNRLSWQWKNFPYNDQEVCVFKTALTFVDSISEIFGPLLTGHSVVVVPKNMTQAVEGLVNVLSTEGVERLVLVPSLLRSILLHCSSPGANKLPKLRLWVCSGEVFPPDLLRSFFKTFDEGQKICNFYGSTEIMGDVTYVTFNNEADIHDKLIDNKVPIGEPIQNTSLYLLNQEQQPVEDGKVGELYVGGINNAVGYVGGAQKEKFVINKWATEDDDDQLLFRTGDYARVVGSQLVYEGRADSQIKIRGHRVDMAEVQTAVQSVEGVSKSCVLCYKPGDVDQALVAFYTSEDEEAVPEVLKVHVAAKLPPYMQPQMYKIADLPLLVNGKVDRQSLLRTYENKAKEGLENKTIDISSLTECSKEAGMDLLMTVLKILGPAAPQSINVEQSFFDIGGNSLNAILTITSLKDLGYNIGISDFLQAKLLKDVIPFMKFKHTNDTTYNEACKKENYDFPYISKPLNASHNEQIIDMLAKSFVDKGDLEKWLQPQEDEYKHFLRQMWEELVTQNVSFVVQRKDTQEIIGVSLNMDLYKEPNIEEVSPNIAYIFDFLESVESPVRDMLPTGEGKVIHSFMMATDESIPMAENVLVIQFMELENIRIGKSQGYSAIFTTNTSPLTQQVCDDLLTYNVLSDYQVNLWRASDGYKPFADAPDSQRAVVTSILF